MSEPTHSRFDELLSKYLDAALDADDEAELLYFLSSERYAARFQEATRLQNEIAGLLAGSVSDKLLIALVRSDLLGTENPLATSHTAFLETAPGAVESVQPWPGTKMSHLVAVAAMLVCLLAVWAAFFRAPAPILHQATSPAVSESAPAKTTPGDFPIQDTPRAVSPGSAPMVAPVARMVIVSVRGEVFLTDDAGTRELSAGQPLEGEATIRTVGRDSRATLGLADGTEIVLMEDTSFSVTLESGRRHLLLNEGMLNATVAKQPEHSPLVFETAEAEATVRGTDLALLKEPEETYLIVRKGVVGLRRLWKGGPEVLIEGGFFGHVEEGADIEQLPMSRLPKKQQLRANQPSIP